MTKIRQIEWDEKSGTAGNVRHHLPRLMADYFVAVRGVLEKDPPPDKLHQLRLASKRVRYTLELFRPCYGPGFEERLAALRQIQQLLGEVNDAVAACRLLSKAMPVGSPRSRRVQRLLETRAGRKAGEFRQHWAKVFDAPGQFAWWTGYLGAPAGLHDPDIVGVPMDCEFAREAMIRFYQHAAARDGCRARNDQLLHGCLRF